jgi:NAD(P)-dependent dehydrogenase (short-subunit alcohol dehydrogenase family)
LDGVLTKKQLALNYCGSFSHHFWIQEIVMQILKDKVAIVTGSSRGIGKAIAICFAGAGCNVVVNYHHSKDNALEVAQKIEERIRGGSLVVKADVSKQDEVERMVTETMNTFGTIDILVNNAGISHHCNFLDVTLEQWNQIITVNLTGVFYLFQSNPSTHSTTKMGQNH